MSDLAIASLFWVTVDAVDIGSWTECSGLKVSYDVQEYKEGGQNGYVHKLPGRISYGNITLKRPIDPDSAKVAKWVASLGKDGARSTASITAYDGDIQPMATWSLVEVFPVSWTGPSLSVDGGKVGTEQLELAHHGFL